jgi:hypothetical protein
MAGPLGDVVGGPIAPTIGPLTGANGDPGVPTVNIKNVDGGPPGRCCRRSGSAHHQH